MKRKIFNFTFLTSFLFFIIYQFITDVQQNYERNSFIQKIEYQRYQKNHPYHPNNSRALIKSTGKVEADKPDLAFQHEFIKTMDEKKAIYINLYMILFFEILFQR